MSSTPVPYSPIVERIPTRDGGVVALKRYAAPGRMPVVFIHGLSVNADLWDLPDLEGPGFRYRSLARMLHDAGYDVWLMNLRGHGAPHMLSTPPPGQRDWCVDHFILEDLPATFTHLQRVYDGRVFVIAASMGAMSLAGYLQGGMWAGPLRGGRIIADPALAAQRQAQMAGCIFAEFPARLYWPLSLYNERERLCWKTLVQNWRRADGDANFPFEIVSRASIIQALLSGLGRVPSSLVKGNRELEPWYRHLPAGLTRIAAAAELRAMRAMIGVAACFTGATNHRAEVILHGRRYVIDDMKAGVLRQMAKCVRRRAFVSFLGEVDHIYSDHYAPIAVPLMVVQGERDRIANARVVKEDFFDVSSSADKTFLLDPDIAHGEIEAAPVACERLYPAMVDWIRARR